MLHEFHFSNFYSFRDEASVSLVLSKHFQDSSLAVDREGFPRLSKAMAIMGANGSGKTNVLKALAFLHWFIGHSFRLQPDESIPFAPHFFAEDDESSEFELLFDVDGITYRYELTLTRQRVLREALFHKTSRAFSTLFLREWVAGDYQYKNRGFGLNAREARHARENCSLISTAAQYDVPLAKRIARASVHRNVDVLGRVQGGADDIFSAADFYLASPSVRQRMIDLLRQWDLGLSDVEVRREKVKLQDGREQSLAIAYGIHSDHGQNRELSLFEESSGTQRAFVLLSSLLPVLESGGLAVIDELESDLHPHMLAAVLELFLNPSTNPKDAQIIFTTHSAELVRQLHKAQVILVEKNEHCGSELWRLGDMQGVRADDNLYAKYMAGAYGAVPYLQ